MFLSLITSSVVAVIQGSWIASSIFLKYFLLALAAKNFYEGTFTSEAFIGDVMQSSNEVVTGLIGVGVLFAVSGLSPSPLLKLFSELVALAYFAFLFWKY
ncbi:MAG: hypothetical protein ABEJ87_00470 [Candidatus Nanohalobium sp.]